jgi:hypothetical protein
VRPPFVLCGGFALGVVKALGAEAAIVIGYDWQVKQDAHHCEGYALNTYPVKEHKKNMDRHWNDWQQRNKGRWGMTVINCTEGGRIPQDMTLREALNGNTNIC